MESYLTIDEVARRTGLTAYTLRYYERIGLIASIARSTGGQRRYAASDMAWIEFLLRLRTTNMPIGKMQTFARLRGVGDSTVSDRRQMLEEHLTEVLSDIEALRQSADALQAKSTITAHLSIPWRRIHSLMKDMVMKNESRYERGLAKLREIDGKAGEHVLESLDGIAPDFARYLIEFPFGDIYCRPGLDLKSREIAVVAALTALGNAAPQLKVHIQAALNVGVTRTEIVETIMQMAVYAGFPAALNGLAVAKEVFAQEAEQ